MFNQRRVGRHNSLQVFQSEEVTDGKQNVLEEELGWRIQGTGEESLGNTRKPQGPKDPK